MVWNCECGVGNVSVSEMSVSEWSVGQCVGIVRYAVCRNGQCVDYFACHSWVDNVGYTDEFQES